MKRLLILSLLCSPFVIAAQGTKLHVQGQKQQAMGNAGTGLIQDASSIYYNPGAISLLENNSASIGVTAVIANSVISDSMTWQVTDSENPMITPITLYVNYGADSSNSAFLRNLEFGLGVYTPYGGSAHYPDEWVGRFILKSMDFKVISIQPTLSYNIANRVGIGVGFVYNMGSIEINRAIYVTDSSNIFASTNIKGKMTGMGINAGIMFKATEELTIGFSYKSKIDMTTTDGAAIFEGIPADLKDTVPGGDIEITIPNPATFTLGLGLKTSEKLSFSLDVNYVEFSVLDTLRVDFATNTTAQEDIAEPRDMKDTWSVQFGAEYMAAEALAIRAGLRYAWSPIPDNRVSPEGGDGNHLAYSLGLGYNIGEHISIDASYTFLSIERHSNNDYYNFIADYKTYASFAGLSFAYKF